MTANRTPRPAMATLIGALALCAAGCAEKKLQAKPRRGVDLEPAGAAGLQLAPKKLYLDVHELGTVSAKDVAEAHRKDLATQGAYGVDFKAYWVDEKEGKVYCLAEAPSADAMITVHRQAHGLVPRSVMEVTGDSTSWDVTPGQKLFLDVHHLGAGRVTPSA